MAALDEALMALGGRHATYIDQDAKSRRSVVRYVTGAVREQGCTAQLPRCGTPERIEVWLEEVNAIVGEAGHLPDKKAFELVDVSGGSYNGHADAFSGMSVEVHVSGVSRA